MTEEVSIMAKATKQPKRRSRGGILPKVLIVVVLVVIGKANHSISVHSQRD